MAFIWQPASQNLTYLTLQLQPERWKWFASTAQQATSLPVSCSPGAHTRPLAVPDPARSHPWPGAGLRAGFTRPAAPAPGCHPAELVATPRNDTVGRQVATLTSGHFNKSHVQTWLLLAQLSLFASLIVANIWNLALHRELEGTISSLSLPYTLIWRHK